MWPGFRERQRACPVRPTLPCHPAKSRAAGHRAGVRPRPEPQLPVAQSTLCGSASFWVGWRFSSGHLLVEVSIVRRATFIPRKSISGNLFTVFRSGLQSTPVPCRMETKRQCRHGRINCGPPDCRWDNLFADTSTGRIVYCWISNTAKARLERMSWA